MDFNVLCFNKKDELLLATTSQEINSDDIVEVLGQDYLVANAGTFMTTMGYSSKIVELRKYKETKKKVG